MSIPASVRQAAAVPEVEHTVGFDRDCLVDALEEHEAVYVSDGGKTIAIAFSPEAFERLIERVDMLELQVRIWQSEVHLREGTLLDHDEVVASTEWLVAGED